MMNHGVFLTEDEMQQVTRLLEPSIEIQPNGIVITRSGDKAAAWAKLNEIATTKGLPQLPDGQAYGLTAKRELVSK